MKKLTLILGFLFLFVCLNAEKKPDVTLEKTIHLLAATTFEKFSYFPLTTLSESEGMSDIPSMELLSKQTEVKSGMILTMALGAKSCWRCQCTKCSWHGNTYGCMYVSGNPCGGWNCPTHGCCVLRTVSWPCEPNGTCTY